MADIYNVDNILENFPEIIRNRASFWERVSNHIVEGGATSAAVKRYQKDYDVFINKFMRGFHYDRHFHRRYRWKDDVEFHEHYKVFRRELDEELTRQGNHQTRRRLYTYGLSKMKSDVRLLDRFIYYQGYQTVGGEILFRGEKTVSHHDVSRWHQVTAFTSTTYDFYRANMFASDRVTDANDIGKHWGDMLPKPREGGCCLCVYILGPGINTARVPHYINGQAQFAEDECEILLQRYIYIRLYDKRVYKHGWKDTPYNVLFFKVSLLTDSIRKEIDIYKKPLNSATATIKCPRETANVLACLSCYTDSPLCQCSSYCRSHSSLLKSIPAIIHALPQDTLMHRLDKHGQWTLLVTYSLITQEGDPNTTVTLVGQTDGRGGWTFGSEGVQDTTYDNGDIDMGLAPDEITFHHTFEQVMSELASVRNNEPVSRTICRISIASSYDMSLFGFRRYPNEPNVYMLEFEVSPEKTI